MAALRHQDFRSVVTASDAAGEHPVIVALPDDNMGMVFERLAEIGSPATVVTTTQGAGLALLDVRPAGPDTVVDSASDYGIHVDTEVSMLLVLLEQSGGIVVCHEVNDVTVTLIDDGQTPLPM
jgi:hypothetical protein